jgi:hypothetical protein
MKRSGGVLSDLGLYFVTLWQKFHKDSLKNSFYL